MSGASRDADPRLYFNGVREDGTYSLAPVDAEELGRRLLGLAPSWKEPPVEDERGHEDPTRKPIRGVDPDDLDSAGWALVLPWGSNPLVERALDDLCDLRADQSRHFRKVFYKPGESVDQFLARLKAPPGLADPERLPYYVLLAGGPEEIPYEIQLELDMVYAVGRISFATPPEYERYGKSVVEAEKRRLRRRRRVAFFAPENGDDRATRRTCNDLARPLSEHVAKQAGWSVDGRFGASAGKAELAALLAGADAPALLFTASHGLQVDPGEVDQEERQGALVTADWEGSGKLGRETYFAAADLDALDVPPGMVAFLFACYSAGTPRRDSFWQEESLPRELAPKPFVSALARRLLAAPGGGALAVVGHVDRAWTTSFDPYGDGGQRQVFESALEVLLEGGTVGCAMDYFDQLAGDTSIRLSGRFERKIRRQSLDPAEFARSWIAHNDARNFVLFGDPAVRLAVPGLR